MRARAAPTAEVFSDYLAAKLGCTPSQVYAFSLADDLRAFGLDSDLAIEAGESFRRLVDHQYSGHGDPVSREGLKDLVARLEGAFPAWEVRS